MPIADEVSGHVFGMPWASKVVCIEPNATNIIEAVRSIVIEPYRKEPYRPELFLGHHLSFNLIMANILSPTKCQYW